MKRENIFESRITCVFGENYRLGTYMPVYNFKRGDKEVDFAKKTLTQNALPLLPTSTAVLKTFACLQKSTDYGPETLINYFKFNRRYINRIYFKARKDETQDKNCQIFWTKFPTFAKNVGPEDIKHFYICWNFTQNVLDKNIITDLKVQNYSNKED